MEGYDHILDTEDDGKNVLQIAEEEDNKSTVEFLKSIKNYTVCISVAMIYNSTEYANHIKNNNCRSLETTFIAP